MIFLAAYPPNFHCSESFKQVFTFLRARAEMRMSCGNADELLQNNKNDVSQLGLQGVMTFTDQTDRKP